MDNKNSSILATSKGAKTNNDSAEKPPNNNNKNSLKFNVINKRAIFLFFLIGILAPLSVYSQETTIEATKIAPYSRLQMEAT